MMPEHLNLGVYQTGTERDYAALTADNHPLGNVFGFSENFFDQLDIIEGETDLVRSFFALFVRVNKKDKFSLFNSTLTIS